MRKNKGLKTVKSEELKEIDEEIRLHRKTIARRIISVVGVLLVIFVGAELYLELRSFSDYSVSNTIERQDSAAVSFTAFGNNIVKYSNDGAVCVDSDNNQIWNQSYEMTSPEIAKCEDYLAIYDKSGIDVYIITKKNPVKHLQMPTNIVSVSIASQGTIAVLMKDDAMAKVSVYDKNGTELAGGAFYQENAGFPVDVALSFDAKIMSVVMVDVSAGSLKSVISFYNFGSVGKNEINNNVGIFEYENTLIPEIEYIAKNKMIALSNDKVMIFDGTEKPSLSKEIKIEDNVKSVIYNEKYVCMVKMNEGDELSYHVTLYRPSGRVVMDADSEIDYDRVYFLENGELCLSNGADIEIYTVHGIRKFHTTFDDAFQYALSQGKGSEYVFIFTDSMQEVRLR